MNTIINEAFNKSITIINKETADINKEGYGLLSSLKKGQLITGTVNIEQNQLSLSIGEHKITARAEGLKDIGNGEFRLFEVKNVTSNLIELCILDHEAGKVGSYIAQTRSEPEQEAFLSVKEKGRNKSEKERELNSIKHEMTDILTKLTSQDIKELEQEGFPADMLTVDDLYRATNRIKETTLENSISTDHRARSYDLEADIQNKLREANLPVTKEALRLIKSALSISDEITDLSEASIIYLIRGELLPTIENLYSAQYNAASYASDKAELNEEAWNKLIPRVKDIIKAAGYEVNTENLDKARELVENRIPLTRDNFIYLRELEELSKYLDKGFVLSRLVNGIKQGITPMEAPLFLRHEIYYKQVYDDINTITDETIAIAVKKEDEINLVNLRRLQKESYEDPRIKLSTLDSEVIKVRRQLEEIRLKLTLESAARLDRLGINIDTEKLEKIVEKLRSLEEEQYKKLFTETDVDYDDKAVYTKAIRVNEELTLEEAEKLAGTIASKNSVKLLRETIISMERLKQIPSAVLGKTLNNSNTQTVKSLLEEGQGLKAIMDKAQEAYEALMTVPNSEYGDSIKKAFNNMEGLLKELGIEPTEANKRATKILSYNNMDISMDNIDKVKAYDLEVNTLIEKLKPQVAVRLIREGINPLKLTIGELNKAIDKLQEEYGQLPEERFSTYLYKLQQQEGINEDERKAYIGIYRLLYNIEKSDGAALGAVIKADREITLNNLLTAVRTIHKGAIDAAVDDAFGMISERSYEGESITEQLAAAFDEQNRNIATKIDSELQTSIKVALGSVTSLERDGELQQSIEGALGLSVSSEGDVELQTSMKGASRSSVSLEGQAYMEGIIRRLAEDVTPGGLNRLLNNITKPGVSTGAPEKSELGILEEADRGIWKLIKDMPVDRLSERLRAINGYNKDETDYQSKLEDIRNAFSESEQAIKFLEDYKVPNTAANIMLAKQILYNGGSVYKKLLRLDVENTQKNTEKILKEVSNLTDTLFDKVSTEKTFNNFRENVDKLLNKELLTGKLDRIKLSEMKNIRRQTSFISRLAEKEFYHVPIMTESGLFNVNLTIIRDKDRAGKVSLTFSSEGLGKVREEFSLKDRNLTGYIECDSRSGLDILRRANNRLEKAAAAQGITLRRVDYCIQSQVGSLYSNPYKTSSGSDEGKYQDTERLLYNIAKEALIAVREAEHKELI